MYYGTNNKINNYATKIIIQIKANPNYWKGHYNWPILVVIELDNVLYLRNVGFYSSTILLTLPITGNSTDPHVSANQWTRPDAKSADIIPQKAATMIVGIFFRCIW